MTRVYSLPKNKEDTIATVSKAKAKSTKAAPKRARGKAGAQAEGLEDDEDDSVEDIVLEAKEAVDLTEDDATAALDEAKEELPTGTIELPKDLSPRNRCKQLGVDCSQPVRCCCYCFWSHFTIQIGHWCCE